jgi:type II secretory pathway component PulM
MKLNRIILFLAIVFVGFWVYRRGRIEFMEGELRESEAMTYIKTNEDPNAFIIYGMVKKQTDDEQIHKTVLTLATEKKWDELEEVLKSI